MDVTFAVYNSIIDSLREHAISGGAPGLLTLAFFDSAGLPTGGAPDFALIILLSVDPRVLTGIILVTTVTAGSLAGCLVLYHLGLKGGGVALSRLDEPRRHNIRQKIDRYGWLAIVVAMMGPPPCPTKFFILSAGAFGMRFGVFFLSVLLGRSLRYGFGGYLAVRFGPHALEMLGL